MNLFSLSSSRSKHDKKNHNQCNMVYMLTNDVPYIYAIFGKKKTRFNRLCFLINMHLSKSYTNKSPTWKLYKEVSRQKGTLYAIFRYKMTTGQQMLFFPINHQKLISKQNAHIHWVYKLSIKWKEFRTWKVIQTKENPVTNENFLEETNSDKIYSWLIYNE